MSSQTFQKATKRPKWMGPPILALVIGINKYTSQNFPSLEGAVADANLFEKFLKERLNVPDADIINLRDEQASRASIISAFASLRDHPKYEKNEAAIIIFYAGHGAQKDKPTAWQGWDTRNGRIEMLCPSDIGCPVNGKECEGVQVTVQGIPDRSISALLNQISKVKSNNITLILDCCNSAGIHRGEDTIRRILDPPPFENDIDQELFKSSESDTKGTRGIGIADGFAGTFDASHVLLAACGSDQVAREDSIIKHGIFTYCFLEILGDEDINTLTYTSLIHKMNLKMPKSQTPHCEGRGANRRLFYKPMPGIDTSFILANCDSKTSEIILKAGAALGITVGSRMAVHAYNFVEATDTLNPRRGYLTVDKVNHSSSVLTVPSDPEKFPFKFPGALFYCCMEQWASLKIALYCKDRIWLETLFPPQERDQSITIVDKVETCDLELTVIDAKVHFDCHHALVKPHIRTRIRHALDVGNTSAIYNVVKSSLHFYYHLTRSNPNLNFDWRRMELKKLEEEPVTALPETFDLDTVFTPIGENLIEKEPARVVVDSAARLGMTIFNESKWALYPYLFYFDPTDLTIDHWYLPPQAGAGPGHVDAPLPANSKLTLGYGGGGVPPWKFILREGDKKDVGFFKLFLSTVHADFSSILQESPFKTDRPRAGEQAIEHPVQFWATQLVTVIQVDS